MTIRSGAALLVLDCQVAVLAGAHERDSVLKTIGQLVGKARAAGVPVVWIQHSAAPLVKGSDEWQIVPELVPGENEPRVEKEHADAFEGSALESVLDAGRLVVAGAETDECVQATLHGAVARGYDAILVADAHTTVDHTRWGVAAPEVVVAEANLQWGAVRAAEVDFGR